MLINFKPVFEDEGAVSIINIAENMRRNRQVASGATIASMNLSATENSLSIQGATHIKTLQTGIYSGTYVRASEINVWANYKGYWEGYSYRANTIARRIYNAGSKLFLNGGRDDVWSNETPFLIDRLKSRIGQIIVETKIVE